MRHGREAPGIALCEADRIGKEVVDFRRLHFRQAHGAHVIKPERIRENDNDFHEASLMGPENALFSSGFEAGKFDAFEELEKIRLIVRNSFKGARKKLTFTV
jgi:hypothetical protein